MPSKVENLPETNEGYGTKEYCGILAPGTTFDWFLTPTYLLPFMQELTEELGTTARILMLGCGNSALSEVMYDAGYRNIVNVDYSAAVITQMRERHASRPGMEWVEMDVLDLQYGEDEFDVVVDKGTMEWVSSSTQRFRRGISNNSAMLTTKGDPWNPPEKDIKTCNQEVSEALRPGRFFSGLDGPDLFATTAYMFQRDMTAAYRRVLKRRPSSRFVYFTFGQPHFRKRYLQDRPGFRLTHREIGPPEGFAYFMYVLAYTGDA